MAGIGAAATGMTVTDAADDVRTTSHGLSVVTDIPNSSIRTATVIGPDGFKTRPLPTSSPSCGQARPPSGGGDIGGGVDGSPSRRARPSASSEECMSPLHGGLGTSAVGAGAGAGAPRSPNTPSSAKSSSSGRSPMLNRPKMRVSSIVRRLSSSKTTLTPPSAGTGGNSYIDFEDSPLLLPSKAFGEGGGDGGALGEGGAESEGSERHVPADDTDASSSPIIASGNEAVLKGSLQSHTETSHNHDLLTPPAERMGRGEGLGVFSPKHDVFTPNSLDLEGAPQEETKDDSKPRLVVVDKGAHSYVSPKNATSPSKETLEQREARLDAWEARLREQQRIHEDRESELFLYQQTISGAASERSSSSARNGGSAAGGLAGLLRSRGVKRPNQGPLAACWHWVSEVTVAPTNHYFSVYALLITVLGIAGFVEAPLVLAFSTDALFQTLAVIEDLMMISDTFVSLRVRYQDKESRFMVENVRSIRSHYVRGWFRWDLLMAVPSGMIGVRWLFVLRLLRILKAEKYQLNKRLEKVVHPSLVRLVHLLVSFCLSVHILAGIYWYIATMDPNRLPEDNEAWEPPAGLLDESIAYQYLVSITETLTLIVGNNNLPNTPAQYGFSAVCTVLGLLAFSTLIGSAASLATNWDATNTARTEQLDEMSHYMRYRKVPKDTQDAILSYLDYTWTSHQSTHIDTVNLLPERLRLRLDIALKRTLVESVPLFEGLPPTGVVALCRVLESSIAMPDEAIVTQGHEGSHMYFIFRGAARVMRQTETGSSIELAVLQSGQFFGEMALVDPTSRRRAASVIAMLFCDLYKLGLEDFDRIANQFPQFRAEIDMSVRERANLNKNITKLTSKASGDGDGVKKSRVLPLGSPDAPHNPKQPFTRGFSTSVIEAKPQRSAGGLVLPGGNMPMRGRRKSSGIEMATAKERRQTWHEVMNEVDSAHLESPGAGQGQGAKAP